MHAHTPSPSSPSSLLPPAHRTSDRTKKVDPTCSNAGCEYYPSKNLPALAKFVDYALTKPEVRFVTFSDLIAWMQVGAGG